MKYLLSVLLIFAAAAGPAGSLPGAERPPDTLLALFGWGGGKDMSPIDDEERERARSALSQLEREVRLVYFSTDKKCKECRPTERLLGELASLSPHLSLDVLSLEEETERAAAHGVDKAPGTAVLGGEADAGIRYYGLPVGYEFDAFLSAITSVSGWSTGLEEETEDALRALQESVTITVFVTKH